MPDIDIHIITKSTDPLMNDLGEFVYSQEYGSVFQHPDMFGFYASMSAYSPVYFIARKGEKIVGSLLTLQIGETSKLKKHFTQRTIVFGDPVIADSANDKAWIFDKILIKLQSYISKNTLYIQFRLFRLKDEYQEVFDDHDFEPQERVNTIIDTSDRQKCWKALSESKRRQIRKSLDGGAKIIEVGAHDIAPLREFYQILNDLFNNKIKKPLADLSFFDKFSGDEKIGKILLIELRGKIIGGIVCPITPKKFIYEWYICGLDKEYKKEGIYPSVLATWAAIDYALKNNIPQFDLMGAGKPGIKYGVRDFKLRFGGPKVSVYRYNKIVNRGLYEVAEVAYNLKRWLS